MRAKNEKLVPVFCPTCKFENIPGAKFCSDCSAPVLTAQDPVLKAQVSAIIKDLIKEQPIVEAEIAGNIAERVFGWAKLVAATATALVALGLTVLGILGVTSYNDFRSFVTKSEDGIKAHIQSNEGEASKIDATLKDTKRKMEDLSRQATRYAGLGEEILEVSHNLNLFIDRSGIIEEFKKANNAFGIDISEYNDAANLDDLKKNNGISFVFLTATHGTNEVQSFTSYWRDSKAAGLIRGAIHLGTTTDPVNQANLFIDTVKPEKTDLLILRIDTTQQLQLMTAADAIAFIARVNERTGHNPIIYANLSFLERLSKDDQKRLSAYPL